MMQTLPRSPVPATASLPSLLGFFSVVAVLSGCAVVIPVPPSSRGPIAGRVIQRSEAAFIEPGATTRREVERRLGPGTREFPQWGVVAYIWETPSWEWIWFVSLGVDATAGSEPVGGWNALLIAYDPLGRVRRKEMIGLKHRQTLDKQVERWVGR